MSRNLTITASEFNEIKFSFISLCYYTNVNDSYTSILTFILFFVSGGEATCLNLTFTPC